MIIMLVNRNKAKSIGVGYMPGRKKPCLVVAEGNTETKYASFNDEQSARMFMDIFADFCGLPEIDWNDKGIPSSFRPS